MKKIFTLLVALIAFSATFAQRNTSNDHYTYDSRNVRTNNNYNPNQDHAIIIKSDNNQYRYNDRNYDNNRRAEIERINRDYDRRINDYRNNRRMNAYERERNIARMEKERNDKLKAFGGGVLVGGILGVLLGTHL